MNAGRVYLVGAGPGDPGLMTVRSLELIAVADVILHDRLIPSSALDGARSDALVIDVGKRGGGASVPQDHTLNLLLEHARAGKTVVRLKGGDPFVFGRGGEEALALRDAGIPFEVVPGITSGVAAPAYAGIPVTHRDHSSAVALVTGHEDPAKPETALDWSALAVFPGTLVFYMGVRQLGHIARSLVDHGRDPAEAVAVVERGTLPGQRTISGTLADISQRADSARVVAPSITVVGPVASLAQDLSWLPDLPLHGVTVAVTRARAQASGLARRLADLGAEVVQAPVIRTEEIPGGPLSVSAYDLICISSPNGARLFLQRLARDGRDARALAGATIAAIGPGTAAELSARGVIPDVVPDRFVAESLVQALGERTVHRALIARAETARDVLPEALRSRGAEVDVLPLYRTVAEPMDEATVRSAALADYLTFTSASTVTFFLEATRANALTASEARIVSIGPVTSAALRAHSLEPDVEAASHDIDGLIDALLADAAERGQPPPSSH